MSTDSGAVTIGALLEKGDHGIGTVEHLDGEMMIVDGVAQPTPLWLLKAWHCVTKRRTSGWVTIHLSQVLVSEFI